MITTKRKVLEEIELIPEDQLEHLYSLLHYYRIGLEQQATRHQNQTMEFAGCWRDLPDAVFDDFTVKLHDRRLATHNHTHFERIVGLEIDDWAHE